MTDEKMKLPRSSYEELVKIIRAYGRLNKPSTLKEINNLVGIGESNVSANNAFLISVGIIEGNKSKAPTEKGYKLARALEHEIESQISQSWRNIVEENDFLNRMVQAVSVRRGMEVSQLENHIAYSAGESKTAYVMTGARTVIDILIASSFVKDDDGKIIPNTLLGTDTEESQTPTPSTTEEEPSTIPQQIPLSSHSLIPGLTMNIQVTINVNPNELDGLGDKLKEFIKSISTPDTGQPNHSEDDQA